MSVHKFFILSDVRRDHATFHEFEVAGTTYTPSGDMYVYFLAYILLYVYLAPVV